MVPYSALTDCDRCVVLVLDDRPDPQLWGHCGSIHSSCMICFFVFAVLSLWHPGDGRDVRKKYNIIIFSLHCFKGFSVGSTHSSSMICFFVFAVVSLWHPGDGRDVREKPVPYNH